MSQLLPKSSVYSIYIVTWQNGYLYLSFVDFAFFVVFYIQDRIFVLSDENSVLAGR